MGDEGTRDVEPIRGEHVACSDTPGGDWSVDHRHVADAVTGEFA